MDMINDKSSKFKDYQEQFVQLKDVRYFIKTAGDKSNPLILFLHGFPDSWYTWRYQLADVADAGYYAVAPDMLGCGETDAPQAIERYSQDEMAADIIGIIDALGYEQAIIVGHDLGASLTWQICLLYPDRVKAAMVLSIPYGGRALSRPTDHMKMVFGDRFFYILYFQEPGVAEEELDADIRNSLLRIFYSLSADGQEYYAQFVASDNPKPAEKYLDTTTLPERMPDWFSEPDLAYYESRYRDKGFRGILNWYRCLDIYWECTEHLTGKKIKQPVYFIAGQNDPTTHMVRKAIDRLPVMTEDLRGVELFDHCGHWISAEQPAMLNQKILEFLKAINE